MSLKNVGPKKHDPIKIMGPQIFGAKKNVWVQKLMVLTNYELSPRNAVATYDISILVISQPFPDCDCVKSKVGFFNLYNQSRLDI